MSQHPQPTPQPMPQPIPPQPDQPEPEPDDDNGDDGRDKAIPNVHTYQSGGVSFSSYAHLNHDQLEP